MNKLPEIVTHPELIEAIVGQFAFMKIMDDPRDRNRPDRIDGIDLNEIYRKADDFFVNFTSVEETIDTLESNLACELASFLAQWKDIVDVVAIQQNVHNRLISNDILAFK